MQTYRQFLNKTAISSEEMEDRAEQAYRDVEDQLYKTKAGNSPHATSQHLGTLTSSILGLTGAAGAGALLGSAIGGSNWGHVGFCAGAGAGALGAALISLAISRKGARTKAEQDAYKESSTWPEYLIPGVALGNLDRNQATRLNAIKKIPKELQGLGY